MTDKHEENKKESKMLNDDSSNLDIKEQVSNEEEIINHDNMAINKIDSNSLEEFDYLSDSVLEIKTYSEEELLNINKNEDIEVEIDEDYLNTFSEIREKEVVTGTVVGINEKEVLIDIGFKAEGVVQKNEFIETPEIGQDIDVYIHTFEDRKGNIRLSKEKADFQKKWSELTHSYENEEIIKGNITRRIKGGMVVDLGPIQAFLPGSQIDIKPVTDFDEFVGVESEFKIVKLNELRQNVVLSRKAILANDLQEKRQEALGHMEVGMVLDGLVKNITDFGAFIDLGGIDGLLHITDISWGRVNHPSEKLKVGQTIKVKVIDFDVEKVRVSLGIKQLTPEPWENLEDKYPIGTNVEGKIVNMMNYGAFVELEEGVEGLIHISEISWIKHIKHPSDMFKVGDDVKAKILSIDINEKKISLGIKQLQENPWDTIESKYQTGSTHDGIVRNLTQFGAFIELEEGIDGLVHISDMSWTRTIRHPKEILVKGDKIKVKVLEVSSEDHRLSLGIKQLEEDPWENIRSNFSSGKVINAKVVKVLDKGIIFDLGDELEGIVPLKRLSKENKIIIKDKYIEGSNFEVTVQEVDEEYKKIILMLDLELDESEENNKTELTNETETDKLEIPKEVIDKIEEEEKKKK